MITKTGFRIIVLASLVSAVAGMALDLWAGFSAPPEHRAYLSELEKAPLHPEDIAALFIAGLGYILALAATLGLCIFWRPARTLAVTATIVLLISEVFVHPLMHTSIAHVFGDAAAIFWGMALAFSFCPPFSESFERRQGRA